MLTNSITSHDEQPPPPPDGQAIAEWLYPRSSEHTFRGYQHAMAKEALARNTLIALPTGLGKTMIASVVLLNFWRWFPSEVVIFMAPTRPLVAQQIKAVCATVGLHPTNDARMITGSDAPARRAALWRGERDEEAVAHEPHLAGRRRIFFCTPQTLSNDLKNGLVDGRSISCICVDEAHHASSASYGHSLVLQQVRHVKPCVHVVGLSATAGVDLAAIQRVVDELAIAHIETRCENDPELRQLTHERLIEVGPLRVCLDSWLPAPHAVRCAACVEWWGGFIVLTLGPRMGGAHGERRWSLTLSGMLPRLACLAI